MGQALEVVFDSTHFEDGDAVTVKYEVLDIVYGLFPTMKAETGMAIVHNKAFAYQHHDFVPYHPGSDGATPADNALDSMGFLSTRRSASGWSPSIVEQDSADAAVLYFNTHGHPPIEADTGQQFFPTIDVLEWRYDINGTGYPPQNSTGKPFTSLVILDTCSSAHDNAYSTWFWPYERYDFDSSNPLNETVNQALFGYAGTTTWPDRAKMAAVYWPWLSAGRTVVEMRNELVDYSVDYEEAYGEPFISLERPYGTWGNVDDVEDCPVWGDPYTRIKGVYTGDTTFPVGWYRDA